MDLTTQEFHHGPTDDKLLFTAPNLIELHFGPATQTLEENTAETRWIKQHFENIKAEHPATTFHVLVDLTRVDSSEYNSEESNKTYRAMLGDKALEKVAVYGLSSGWTLFVDFLTLFTKHKLKTFVTEAQARQWLSECHAHSHQ